MKLLNIMIISCLICSSVFSQNTHEYKFDIHEKSESTAKSYSILGTIVPITSGTLLALAQHNANSAHATLILSGFMIGPGVGHLYANNAKNFFIGISIRLTGFALIMFDHNDYSPSEVNYIVGPAILLIGMFRDYFTVDNSVRDYNDKLYSTNYHFSPTIYTQNDNLTFGLQFKFTR